MIAQCRRAFTANRVQRMHYSRQASMSRDESASIRDFQTTSSPSTSDTQPPCIAALRHRAQCNPWILQLTSGLRTDMLTGTPSTQDLLIRIKPKILRNPPASTTNRMLAIDELESFSRSSGKSRYVSLSARGMHAFATDIVLQRMLKGEGWTRPDFVEHCARVLRLRVLSTMHRAHIEFFAHAVRAQNVNVPERGFMVNKHMGRLQAMREHVKARIINQDAQWTKSSIYTILPQRKGIRGKQWHISTPLPHAGLHCIIQVPVPKLSGHKMSVSSELHARSVWESLLNKPVEFDVLDQSRQWNAHSMTGAPEPYTQPTLSVTALEHTYYELPHLTPDSMHMVKQTVHRNSLAKTFKNMHAQLLNTARERAEKRNRGVERDLAYRVRVTYPVESGTCVTKTVPVYVAQNLFGDRLCASVVSWLLGLPTHTHVGDEDVEMVYVGVVALPCTADLATQLHRAVEYAKTA
ncbi:hypothetical protein IWW41_002213 [Coemansia sp. RSA 2522]|nr:hypothetical protein IW144_001204 [Coemansia sp. RSA 522]KAJ2433166.1 hypothetical protein IWW41_002213 [Coemansia sp. RSA 2522]